MGRPEDLPEAIPSPREPSTLPEVVPELDSTPQHVSEQDLSPQQIQAQAERDKYLAQYDLAPMIPYEALPDPSPVTPQTARALMSPGSSVPWDPILPVGDASLYTETEKDQPRRVCGCTKRTFIVIVIMAILIVVAGVVGSVAGNIKSKSSSDSEDTKPTAVTTSSSLISSTTSTTTITPPLPTPTKSPVTNLANQTDPGGIAFQAYSEPNFEGNASQVYRLEDYYDLGITAKSYVWLPNGTYECCVTFCANATTATGWWCDERRRPEADKVFRRVQIWCGRTNPEVQKVKKVECSRPETTQKGETGRIS
ncbi:hypothetical protein QBC38DRAFT_37978 [Podospora fimiseda]|uniref:Uncharacterized protein n=1 Tax=Podospora fimiseda TaxID=252190 RepID=A0AAN7GPC3_9PEZI|nr:hypothetical protein QBC38DRAFT_37978 [Podospora fimiseda]